MTKKHYEAIAKVINDERGVYLIKNSVPALSVLYYTAVNLADFFALDNPRFDRTRFLQACGIEHYPTCPICQLRDGAHRTYCKYEQDK